MTRAWQTIARVATAEGPLELRQRPRAGEDGPDDYLITVGGRVLMTSSAHRSEDELAQLGCAAAATLATPRVLVGGLGMGFTLRAALDVLPARAAVTVAELSAEVVAWCRGPLASLTGGAVSDPRVTVVVDDVAKVIAAAPAGTWDAIVLDLYEGPSVVTQRADDPCFGAAALGRAHAALRVAGVLGIWAEDPDEGFVRRFAGAGFAVVTHRGGRGGRRHVVYVGARREPGSGR